MKYTAIFESACPFTNYYHISNAASKSFVRVVDYVRRAASRYSFEQGVDGHDVTFHHIHILDNRNDLNEIATMVFSDENNNRYLVTIVEDDE